MAKNVERKSQFSGLTSKIKNTATNTPTHEYTHTPTPTVKERKTRRVQLLMKESTVDALDAYAKRYDTSRNDIIQNLVEKFLEENENV